MKEGAGSSKSAIAFLNVYISCSEDPAVVQLSGADSKIKLVVAPIGVRIIKEVFLHSLLPIY